MGNLVQTEAPVGPDCGSWLSALASSGTNFHSVIPFGPYLSDEQDLESLKYRVGFTRNLRPLTMFVMFAKVILAFFVSPALLLYLTWKMLR